MLGSEHNDEFFMEAGQVRTRTNRCPAIQLLSLSQSVQALDALVVEPNIDPLAIVKLVSAVLLQSFYLSKARDVTGSKVPPRFRPNHGPP